MRHPVWWSLVLLVAAALLPLKAEAAERWEKEISKLEAGLQSGEWKKTVERAVKLRGKIIEKVPEPAVLAVPAARTLVVQAIAEANLGRDEAALWHWIAAQNWLDGLPEQDLSAYGRARDILEGRSLADLPEGAPGPPVVGEKAPRYREVKIRRIVRPVYPSALVKSGMEGKVRVRLVVKADGRPFRPEVLDAGLVPTMAFPALDALGQWQFDPATEEGKPVPVVFEVDVRYP